MPWGTSVPRARDDDGVAVGQEGRRGHDQRHEQLPGGQPRGQIGRRALRVERTPPIDHRNLETLHPCEQDQQSDRDDRGDHRQDVAVRGGVDGRGHPEERLDPPGEEQHYAEGHTRCAAKRDALFSGAHRATSWATRT